MVLPAGVNKASGLVKALAPGTIAHNMVAVGDAENDQAFLSACECAVAVANALPTVKDRADLVAGSWCRGRRALGRLIGDDLRPSNRGYHDNPLGRRNGAAVTISPFETVSSRARLAVESRPSSPRSSSSCVNLAISIVSSIRKAITRLCATPRDGRCKAGAAHLRSPELSREAGCQHCPQSAGGRPA